MKRVLASGKKASDVVFFEKGFEVPDYDDHRAVSRTRWRIIHTPWFGIYLHRWNRPDPRPTLHNHPWTFFSIILKGEYSEKRMYPPRLQTQGGEILWSIRIIKWLNFVRRTNFHTIYHVQPGTLSLMFVGRTHEDWGYWTDKGYVNYDKHPHNDEFKAAMEARKR